MKTGLALQHGNTIMLLPRSRTWRARPRFGKKAFNTTVGPCYPSDRPAWTWLPSSYALRAHYFHDIGFLACFMLTLGCLIFWLPCLVSLPPLFSLLDTRAEIVWFYWAPQRFGGVLFVVSGVFFALETQRTWWHPEISVLGWHVGAWNIIGGEFLGPLYCGGCLTSLQGSASHYVRSLA